MQMTEGELKRRIDTCFITEIYYQKYPSVEADDIIDEARKEFPQSKQVNITDMDKNQVIRMMEQKIIAYENFGKKWLGE